MTAQEAASIIVANKNHLWKDAESIRDAKIGAPYACWPFTACVCLELNAKNSFGGYTGLQKTVANFEGRTVNNLRVSGPYDQCDRLSPLPELSGAPAPATASRR